MGTCFWGQSFQFSSHSASAISGFLVVRGVFRVNGQGFGGGGGGSRLNGPRAQYRGLSGYLEVHGTYEPIIAVLITLLGHLRGL